MTVSSVCKSRKDGNRNKPLFLHEILDQKRILRSSKKFLLLAFQKVHFCHVGCHKFRPMFQGVFHGLKYGILHDKQRNRHGVKYISKTEKIHSWKTTKREKRIPFGILSILILCMPFQRLLMLSNTFLQTNLPSIRVCLFRYNLL